MPIYSWDEIKAAGDCVAYMTQVLGAAPVGKSGEWTRYNCPWRPGADSESFAVRRSGWTDHRDKESGTIIDLCARARHNGDVFAAAVELGAWLGLKPKTAARKSSHRDAPPANMRIAKTYDYRDIDDALRYQVVRLDPKDFRQRRPDPERPGEWIWNLKGVELIPYRLREWVGKKSVVLVEGEKDADSLNDLGVIATTLPMGAGKWRDDYTRWFAGKSVTIWADADEAGAEHAARVAWELRDSATSISIVTAPPPHKDASDWIAAGATRADIDLLLAEAESLDRSAMQPPKKNLLSEAKLANETAFRNFEWSQSENGKDVKRPRIISEMRDELFRRFWGFPRRCGGEMFDHDRKTGRIRTITSPAGLLAWIAEKSGHPVEWARVEGCPTKEEFFETIFWASRVYNAISGVPSHPIRDDVYYTHRKMPAPDPALSRLEKLLDFFCPATDLDRTLLRALFATPLWYSPGEDRPIFVIDSRDGKGVGKTKLVHHCASLYGDGDLSASTPLSVEQRDLKEGQQIDRLKRRIMSGEGRRKRILLVDNVVGYYDASALASLATDPSLSGMAPYGRQEETRPNDLTYCLTVNSATLGKDLIDRAVFIELRRPRITEAKVRHWERKVISYIAEHRMEIIADILHALQRGITFDNFHPTGHRRDAWEECVLAPLCKDMDEFEAVWQQQGRRAESANGDRDDAETIRERFKREIASLGLDPENSSLWLRSEILKVWVQRAIPGFGGRDGRGAVHVLRNLAKDGELPEMSAYPQIWPSHGQSRTRGMFWRRDLADDPEWYGDVHIIGWDGERTYCTNVT